MKKYKDHPIASLFPLMSKEELQELAQDIEAHGCRAPITLFEGKILDGRNRYRACLKLGIEPKFREFKEGNPLDFVLSTNLHRRHLTTSQRAIIAAKLAKMPKGGNRAEQTGKFTSLVDAAKTMNVSEETARDARKVMKDAPEKVAAIKKGEKTVSGAIGEMKREKSKQPTDSTPKDQTNYPIPDSILEDWTLAEETGKRLLRALSDIRTEVREGIEEEKLIYRDVLKSVLADLNNSYTSLKSIVPHAVCTSCLGRGRAKCNLCKGRGFLSQFAYQQFVPEETKTMREKLKT